MNKKRKTRETSTVLQWRRKGQPNWLELPRDVLSAIFVKVGAIEVLRNVRRVCSEWRNLSEDPIIWHTIDMHHRDGIAYCSDNILDAMCRRAIDLSSGQLTDITVDNFATDSLLKYITDSTSNLRRLRLILCYDITDMGLALVAQKLPQLEELDISISHLSEYPLETIGQNCPQLRTLKFNIECHRTPHIESNKVAFAIAETMPALHHLQLVGNKLTNDGLLAILDGCPNLESLDLRQCFNLKLEGKLERRCAEQIKDFRRPCDPIDDYPFGGEDVKLEFATKEFVNALKFFTYDMIQF
ncbi:putative F-box/LRR-repeat protein 23 [Arachis stenosperma]|uniref:putative F-box/LRR-repeat protein 23 n=1 Tax=Arachis stenosperma TaxID=217475 RepID=UPI0025AD7CC7|nr:putative F-box/LRR-repeat protein 23 [Arachis stenosperma]